MPGTTSQQATQWRKTGVFFIALIKQKDQHANGSLHNM
jgi:hypothetical protein